MLWSRCFGHPKRLLNISQDCTPLHRHLKALLTFCGVVVLSASHLARSGWGLRLINMAVCQNLVPLVNIKIAGKWMFIPLKMVFIGIDPYPYGKMIPCSFKTNRIGPFLLLNCQWKITRKDKQQTHKKYWHQERKRKGKIKAWHRQKRILKHILEALKAFPSPYFTVVYENDPTSPYLGWFP